MKKKNGMILLLIFVIALIVILITITQKSGKETPTSTYSANVDKVLNQGGSILEYDNKAFLVGEHIYMYDLKNNNVEVLTNSSYTGFYEKMYIQHNNLLFTSKYKTYAYDLNTGNIKEIIDGQLEYADENQYIYTMNKEGIEYLYFSSYDKNNMTINNEVMYNLAYGTEIFFLREQDDLLLFGSQNSWNTQSIFYVDIGEQKCEVLIDACNLMTVNDFVINDVVKYDNKMYLIVGMLESNSIISYVKNYNLYQYDTIYRMGELRYSNVESKFSTSSSGKLYAQGISNGKTILLDFADSLIEKDCIANEIFGNMKFSMSIVDDILYLDGESIGEVAINSIINDAWHIGDNFYIKCSSSSETNLYLYNKELIKIY